MAKGCASWRLIHRLVVHSKHRAMKLFFIVVLITAGPACVGQSKRLIPGLIPLALKKGGYEVNVGFNYDSYNKDYNPSGVTGVVQGTYGVLNWLNVGIDVMAF